LLLGYFLYGLVFRVFWNGTIIFLPMPPM
jgi:hypothetical protein